LPGGRRANSAAPSGRTNTATATSIGRFIVEDRE
jgi:hypothetical protein